MKNFKKGDKVRVTLPNRSINYDNRYDRLLKDFVGVVCSSSTNVHRAIMIEFNNLPRDIVESIQDSDDFHSFSEGICKYDLWPEQVELVNGLERILECIEDHS